MSTVIKLEDHRSLVEEVEQFWTQKLPEYLSILEKMVSINSFTRNPQGVEQLRRYTEEIFTPLGFESTVIPSRYEGYASHLLLTKRGHFNKTIGFISHLDTVYPPEEEVENDFHWRVVGDKIYGPGTNDIKGGTLFIFMLMDALKTIAPQYFEAITWKILLDASEEELAEDFGELCRQELAENGIAGLIFECGTPFDDGYSIVVSRKGRAVFRAVAQGRGAHPGTNHEEGASAILQLAEAIRVIEAMTDYEKQLTVNIGKIHGGFAINRVPHHAEAIFEMRTFFKETYEEAKRKLLTLEDVPLIKNHRGTFTCQLDVQCTQETPPWFENEGTKTLFDVWKKAGETLGMNVFKEYRGGGSDGNHISEAIPIIDGLGPIGDFSHSSQMSDDGSKEQEFIYLSSIIPKSKLNFLAILSLIDAINETA